MPKIPRLLSDPFPAVPRLGAEAFGGGASSFANAQAASAIAEVTEKLAHAEQQAKLGAAAASAASEAIQGAEDLAHDPDYDSREPRFAQLRREIVSRHRKGLLPAYAQQFDLAFAETADRVQTSVRHAAWKAKTDEAKANLDEGLRELGNLAGQENDPRLVHAYRLQALRSLQAASDADLITRVDAVNRGQAFLENLEMAGVRRDIRVDPDGAAARLLAGDYDLAPERRQILIEEAQREADRDVNRRRLLEDRAQAGEKRARLEAARVAYTDLILKAAKAPGINADDVEAVASRLTDKQIERATSIVANGGTLRDSESNPFTLRSLTERLRSGDLAALDDAGDEVTAGRLSQSDYEGLLEASTLDKRYSDQFRFLHQSLDVGEAMMDRTDRFVAMSRSAKAERAFRDALRANPEMGQKDAWTLANDLASSALFIDTKDLPAADLDVDRTAAQIADDLQSGRITLEEATRRSHDLRQADELLRHLKTKPGGAP